MSYEAFRADLISHMTNREASQETITSLLSMIDEISANYDFSPKPTSLIVHDGMPDTIRVYIAAKSVQNLKKTTLSGYYSTLRHFFSTIKKPIQEVSANDIRMYLYMYKENRRIADSTLEHIRIQLNSFFEWCMEEEICPKNPVKKVPTIRCGDPERLPMSPLELETVRKNCETLREKALVDFLYSTAARVQELCDIRIENVDFAEHVVHIEHGKGDKGRTTFLNAEAEVSLKSYLSSRTDDCPYLFVTSYANSHKLTPKSIQKSINKIVSRCNLSVHVTPHIFRHTAASLALRRGMPIEQVQRFLGHARIQTTLRYAKVLDFDVKLSHQKFIA